MLGGDIKELALVKSTLQFAGHDCHVFVKGGALERKLQRGAFELLLLVWHLPESTTGPGLVQWARSHMLKNRIPVLLATGEQTMLEGLAAGADDTMARPLRPQELAARVQTLLHRARSDVQFTDESWGRYRFLAASRQVEFGGKRVTLRPREFDLALMLFRNVGRLLSRQHLLEALWRTNGSVETEISLRSLDTHVSNVRRALRLREESNYMLNAVYGQGYRMEALDTEAHSVDQPLSASDEALAGGGSVSQFG